MQIARFARLAVVLVTLLTLASPAKATPVCDTPREAAETTRRVEQYTQNLEDEGFNLKGVKEQPIYYFVRPKAPYLWGNIVFTFARPADGWSLLVDYVEVTVSIRYTEDGYKFDSMSTNEYTVH